MKRYYIELVLVEDGNTTYLGEVPLKQKEAEAVKMLEWKKPGLLKRILKVCVADLVTHIRVKINI